MRKNLPLLMLSLTVGLGWSNLALAEDIHATTAVSAATIFADRALVSRTGQLKLPAGAHTIIVENMPAGFDESSLRVEGSGRTAVKIGAVEVKRIYLAELAQAAERERAKALQAKQDEKTMVEAEIEALKIRQSFIEKVAANGANNQQPNDGGAKLDFTPEKWTQAWTTLQSGMAETAKGLATKQIELRKIGEDIAKLQRDYAQVQTAQRERRDVQVRVESQEATDFDLTMQYQTRGVAWNAVYDARLDTGKGEILLEQYGMVAQNTGEDWQNVALTLSTARPELGTEMPRLNPWYIATIKEVYAQNAALGGAFNSYRAAKNQVGSAPAALSAPMESDGAVMDAVEELKEVRREAEMPVAQAITTDYSAMFQVPGKVGLKSINTPAKFFIGKQPLKASLHVEVSPRTGTQAYLFAKVKNTEKFPIIPGSVAKYRDGAFMGNAGMSLLRPGETLGLSFGIDDRVKVDYQKTSQTQDNPTLYFVGDITVERAYQTKIKNLHDKPIDITVFDQYPIASDADIKTELQEDKTTKGYTVDADKRQGVIQWAFTYQPQEEKALDLGFRVKYPKNARVPNF